ncbi:unnamed protein product [Rhizophagus irregularis]|nr:unnamed protein product [Rhizophagus irregularis]
MICFRFSSRSSGKIEIRSQDPLELPMEDVDAMEILPGFVSLEELETWVEGTGVVGTLTSDLVDTLV